MAKKGRFSAEKKIEILREHLENQVAVSELANRYPPPVKRNKGKQL